MSIGAKCDICGIPLSTTEPINVFRMWNGVRIVQIEDIGLQGIPYDENFYVCDNCFEQIFAERDADIPCEKSPGVKCCAECENVKNCTTACFKVAQ